MNPVEETADILKALRAYADMDAFRDRGTFERSARLIGHLVKILRDVEWAGRTCEEPCCPICGAFQNMNRQQTTYPYVKVGIHQPDCRLALVLGIQP